MAVRQTQVLVTLSFSIKAGLKGRCSGNGRADAFDQQGRRG